MARKVVNRKQLREEADAAERAGATKKAPAKKAKKPTKRKSRSKSPEDIRKRIFWGVTSQSLKTVAKYEYSPTGKKAAEQKAEELSKGGKSPHFVQKLKEEITE